VLPESDEGGDGGDEEPMLNVRQVFSRLSDEELRREARRRRRKGRKSTSNCGNGFGGFTDSNRCASGPHDYPKTRKKPSKSKNERGVGEEIVRKHRTLVEEGYPDDQAWAIAYDMVAKSRHSHEADSAAHRDMIAELVVKGMSEETAAEVVKRRMKGLNSKGGDGHVPPESVAANARRALEVREGKPESQRGMTAVGVARARDLSNRKALSIDTLRRMVSFFERHEVDKKGETWDEQGKGWQAWYGWGGDEGWSWARGIVAKEDGE
jgi:hypothetical protein